VATTATNIDRTARTAREMAEAQRDSFEAIAENFAAAQRRGIGLAEGGLEFMRLQEDNARAAQEFFANGVRLLQLQQKNAEFVQGWMGEALEVVREQTEQNVRTAETFARAASRQQENMRSLTQGWVGAYRDFFSPFAYFQEGMRAFQQVTQQSLEATEQVARQGLRVAEQTTRQGLRVAEGATEHTEDVLRQTEKATREAELRTAVMGALGTADYDELSVAEVSRRIEGLPTEQLKKVREFEKNHKNRDTLIEQIDRKIRANKSS
jgi:predicted nuclease with RNAse H fold